MKIGFVHAREDPKIGAEPKCQVPRYSNGWTTEKGLIFNTGPYGGHPLKNQNFVKRFLHAREDQCHIFMNLGPQMADIRVDNRKGVNF